MNCSRICTGIITLITGYIQILNLMYCSLYGNALITYPYWIICGWRFLESNGQRSLGDRLVKHQVWKLFYTRRLLFCSFCCSLIILILVEMFLKWDISKHRWMEILNTKNNYKYTTILLRWWRHCLMWWSKLEVTSTNGLIRSWLMLEICKPEESVKI